MSSAFTCQCNVIGYLLRVNEIDDYVPLNRDAVGAVGIVQEGDFHAFDVCDIGNAPVTFLSVTIGADVGDAQRIQGMASAHQSLVAAVQTVVVGGQEQVKTHVTQLLGIAVGCTEARITRVGLSAQGTLQVDHGKVGPDDIVLEVLEALAVVVGPVGLLGGKPYTGYPCFSAPDSYAQRLKDVGFDLFLTANNHCLDRRDKGLVRTCQTLDSLHIPHIGTYRDQQERDRLVPYIVNVKGIKIAFLDYTYGTNGIPVQGNVIVNLLDQQQIERDIVLARERGADAICVNLHWGIEYQLKPVAAQRTLADWLVAQGVDLIIGGHPHVVEPMEMRYSQEYDKNVLLVYSMGNFISNQSDIDTRGGAMV